MDIVNKALSSDINWITFKVCKEFNDKKLYFAYTFTSEEDLTNALAIKISAASEMVTHVSLTCTHVIQKKFFRPITVLQSKFRISHWESPKKKLYKCLNIPINQSNQSAHNKEMYTLELKLICATNKTLDYSLITKKYLF